MAVLGLLLAWAAPAATSLHYWTGQGSTGYWSDPQNWAGSVPTGGDQRLIFLGDSARLTNTNNLAAGTTYESIWLVGPGYDIHGNRIRTDYVRGEFPFGTSGTFRPAIDAAGDLLITVDHNNAHLVLAGRITLTSDNLIISGQGAGDVTIGGAITGQGHLIKSNAGDLRLAGFGANSYEGETYVNAGVLRLNRYGLAINFQTRPAVAIPGPLHIGSGTSGLIGQVAALERDHQIANDVVVRVHGSGSLELGGHDEMLAGLVLRGGTVITGSGRLTLSGDVVAGPASKRSLVTGRLHLGSSAGQRLDVAAGANLQITASITGPQSVSLHKTGPGPATLTGQNVYEGATFIHEGTLRLTSDKALGDAGSGTFLEGGTLELAGVQVLGESLTLPEASTLQASGASNAWTGPIQWSNIISIQTAVNTVLDLAGPITGSGGLRKLGSGRLRLTGVESNHFSGTVMVHEGTLDLAKGSPTDPLLSVPGDLVIGDGIGSPGSALVRSAGPEQIAATSQVTLQTDGQWQLDGWTESVDRLGGDGVVSLGGGLLRVGTADGESIFGGLISGPGVLHKAGQGNFTLAASAQHDGGTFVQQGTLTVHGTLTGSAAVEVAQGAALVGSGTLEAIQLQSGGRLSPGTGTGVLTVQSGVDLSDGTFQVELNGPVAGSGHDRLDVGGDLVLTGASLKTSLGFAPSPQASFIVIHKTSPGPATGTFAGLPEGGTFLVGGTTFQVTYAGGDGNDVALISQGTVPFPPPQIESGQNGGMTLQGQAMPGQSLTVWVANELQEPMSWKALATITADASGQYNFLDEAAGKYAARFYRVLPE